MIRALDAVQWVPDASYDDLVFGNTKSLLAEYAAFSATLEEDSQNVTMTPITDRGVAAAAVGTLLTVAIQRALSTCRIIGSDDGDRCALLSSCQFTLSCPRCRARYRYLADTCHSPRYQHRDNPKPFIRRVPASAQYTAITGSSAAV